MASSARFADVVAEHFRTRGRRPSLPARHQAVDLASVLLCARATYNLRARRGNDQRNGSGATPDLVQATHGDGPAERAYHQLKSLGVAGTFSCREDPDAVLGGFELTEGTEAGPSVRRARVGSPIALACLQYRLDDLGATAAVRIRLCGP